MQFPADAAFKPSVLTALGDFLAGALTDQGFRVISPADVGAVLGLERQRQLLGCAESSCLAEIGGALGVDFLVRGSVAALDRDTALNLTLIDRRGQTQQSVRTLVHGNSTSDLIHALDGLVPRLVAPIRASASTPPAAAGGLVASSSATAPGPGTGAYVKTTGGGAALVAGAVLGVLSLQSASQSQTLAAGGNRADADSASSRAALEGRVGVGLLLVGAVVTSLGVWDLASSGGSP